MKEEIESGTRSQRLNVIDQEEEVEEVANFFANECV